jgi:hypothetical protein
VIDHVNMLISYCAKSGPLAADSVIECDADSIQSFECFLAMERPGGGIALLPVLDGRR